jgi:serine/threonine protein kinase
VISDFGVSSQIKGNMDVGRYCGSPGFMAPEIYECEFNQNATYNEKCDIFSLGCILYRL